MCSLDLNSKFISPSTALAITNSFSSSQTYLSLRPTKHSIFWFPFPKFNSCTHNICFFLVHKHKYTAVTSCDAAGGGCVLDFLPTATSGTPFLLVVFTLDLFLFPYSLYINTHSLYFFVSLSKAYVCFFLLVRFVAHTFTHRHNFCCT